MIQYFKWTFTTLLAIALTFGLSSPTQAHTRSETHSAWQIVGSMVHAQFTVPELEAKRLVTIGEASPSDEHLSRYIAAHVAASARGQPCTSKGAPHAVAATPGYRRFELTFQCPEEKDIRIRSSAFFELVATHTHFARVEDSSGHFSERLITADRQELEVANGSDDSPLHDAGLLEFIRLGIEHILTGIDHQSFLLGLVLISRRVRDLVFVVTGFTLGHSATLALAVTGVVRPHPEYIDALVGLTIALIGAENVIAQTHRPVPVALGFGGMLSVMALAALLGSSGLPALLLFGAGLFAANYLMVSGTLRDAARLRLVVTLVFGLIHGFGFASNLLEMRLPMHRLAELLVGFNLGVEIAQLSFVILATVLAALFARLRYAPSRAIVTDVVAPSLVGIGLYWFAVRCYA